MQYTVTLTEAQDKAFRHIAVDPQEYIENAILSRCRAAIDEIARAEIERKLVAGETISGSKEEIVLAANIKTAAQMNAEAIEAMEAEIARRALEQQGA